MRWMGIPILVLFAIPAPGQQQQQPSRGGGFYSLEKEAALGTILARDFRRKVPSIDDADLHAYITKVVARLNEFAQSPFPIIEISGGTDVKPDTVGFPGGHLFVPLRLLANAQDEAGLAQPVAHAMAHIASHQAAQGPITTLATVPLIFIANWAYHDATNVPLGLRKFQEENEAHADQLAAEWVKRSGFADATFETGEFVAMRDRARALAPPTLTSTEPPSLRKPRP